MNVVGMGIAASSVLVFVVDLIWKRAGGAPVWWLHLADVLIPSALSVDATYWFAIGEPDKGIAVTGMAIFFWWLVIDATMRDVRASNKPNG